MDDYRLSNLYLTNFQYDRHLPPSSQDAIATILSAREDFLNAAREETERMYGDVDTYLCEGVGLSKKDIRKLQRILLVTIE